MTNPQSSNRPPANWYPDTNIPGTERYWDGTAWTINTRQVSTPQAQNPTQPDNATQQSTYYYKPTVGQRIFGRHPFLLMITVFVILTGAAVACGFIFGGN